MLDLVRGPCEDTVDKVLRLFSTKSLTPAETDTFCSSPCLDAIVNSINEMHRLCNLDHEGLGFYRLLMNSANRACVRNENCQYCAVIDHNIESSDCAHVDAYADESRCCLNDLFTTIASMLEDYKESQYLHMWHYMLESCDIAYPNSCLRTPGRYAPSMKATVHFTLDTAESVELILEAVCEDFAQKSRLRGEGQVACSLTDNQPTANGKRAIIIDITAYGDASGVAGLGLTRAALTKTNWTEEVWETASAVVGAEVKADRVETTAPVSGAAGRMIGVVAVLIVLVMLM